MAQFDCKICQHLFEDEKKFNSHLRQHKITQEEYYLKYFPKVDKLTGAAIPFKNSKQYLAAEFIHKKNMVSWVKKQPKEIAQEYCKNLLIDRKNKKNLIYSPSQIELRTLPIPSILVYNELFENYYNLCESLGLKNKYKKINKIDFKETDYAVQIDTREQKPLIFKDTEITNLKLDFGDYKLSSGPNQVYFERKGLSDFISTLSFGFERFCRELERASAANEFLIIIVEETLNNLMGFNYLPHISKKIRVTPDFITRNMRDIIQKYPKVQFLFCDGRVRTVEVMKKILFMGNIYKEIDLQLAYDGKII